MASLRKVKYFVANSLDGFIAREDGSVDWLFMDQDYVMAEFFASVDTAIMGRKTFEKMQELAPDSTVSPTLRHFVFSHTLPAGSRGAFTVVNEDVATWLQSFRQHAGKDIWLVGGGETVQALLRAGCVDELGLTIHPRLLGAGVPLFPAPYPEIELELLCCEQYATGLVRVFYGVKR